MFLTERYGEGFIHIKSERGREEIKAQIPDLGIIKQCASVKAAKRFITMQT